MAKIIETERLILRPFIEEDRLFVLDMNENEVMQETLPDIQYTKEELLTRDDWIEVSEGKVIHGPWIMWVKESNTPIGSIKCSQMPKTDLSKPPVIFTEHVEIGYRCIPESWGKGYMSEAAQAVTKYVFTETDQEYLVACFDPENTGSEKVLRKIGMKDMGELFCHDMIHPFFKITKEDWLAQNA